jgi:hypothetical protein
LYSAQIISIFEIELATQPDAVLSNLKVELQRLEPLSQSDVARSWSPSGQHMTRDAIAMAEGNTVPAHISALAEVASLRHSSDICHEAANIAMKAASHLERRARKRVTANRVGTNVFIGHGRSRMWLELKVFVENRLGLRSDEFNQVPVAGITTTARLKEMLDDAAIAFLIMTAEDEMLDGGVQARMNVVHEAGLFQGRLGFKKPSCCWKKVVKNSATFMAWGTYPFPRKIFQLHSSASAAC